MHLSSTVLLGAVLLTYSDCASTTTASKITVVDTPAGVHSFSSNQNNIQTKRFLRSHDEERAGFAELAKAGVSKIIDPFKLQKHLDEDKSAVQVLGKLKLGYDALDAVKNSKLEMLSKYVDMVNDKHPNSKISLIGTLTARYGDDSVAQALAATEQYPKLAKKVKKLRNDQLTAWLDGGKSVDDIFRLLKLRNDDYEALASLKLEVLEAYIKKFNSDKSAHETLVKTLEAGFGGENALASIITTAKAYSRTSAKAKELDARLISHWLEDNMLPERVFTLLKLDRNVDDVLSNGKLGTFVNYIAEFNKINPNKEVSLLATLTTNYGEVAVAKALVFGRQYSVTKILATKLQAEQLKKWLDSGRSVDDVFKLLKLQDNELASVTSREIDALDEYIKLFNREEGGEETLLKALATGFGGESQLASILMSAKTHSTMSSKPYRLQNAQFNQWLGEGLDPVSVLTNVFKVPESNLGSATDMQNSIAKEFKTFYDKEIHISNDLQPRRS
uniref:PaRXLR68 n=1 Tax=Phytophthora agathidicida TaxID=1642459 RepID=A0A7G4WI57_9STRA|nr:PaRXLR68 [Phytophthora agathidicida]